MQLRRSTLLVPGTRSEDETLALIGATSADLVCLDLEDTVVAARKDDARLAVARLLRAEGWGRSDRAVRINPVSTPDAAADLEAVLTEARGQVDVLLLSKVESADEIRWIDAQIDRIRRREGFDRDIRYTIGIESAGAFNDIDAIAAASPNVGMLGLAIGDLSISLGIDLGGFIKDPSQYPGDIFHFHRSRLILAARVHGVLALDPPWPIVADLDATARDSRWGMMLGMDGKLALTPEQVTVIHRAYAPGEAEVARFGALVAEYERSAAQGQGSAALDGEFIDPVTLGLARRVMARAAAPI